MTENENKSDGLKALKQKRAELERLRQSVSSDLNVLDAAITVFESGSPRDTFILLPKPTVAVRDLLRNNPRAWSFSEIVDEINRAGVSSNAVNISSSVSSALRTLERANEITITGMKRKLKYKWSADN